MVKIVADFVLSSSGHFRKVLNKRGGVGGTLILLCLYQLGLELMNPQPWLLITFIGKFLVVIL